MSSTPFALGLDIVDSFKFAPQLEGQTTAFVMRSKDKNDCMRKLLEVLDDVPQDMVMRIYHIGCRPDNPVPVARWFSEVEITPRRPFSRPLFYQHSLVGRKHMGS